MKNRKSNFIRILTPTLLAALVLNGCTVISYTSESGARFRRGSFGSTTAIQSLVFEVTTNGIRRVELRGYQNDSTQALGTIAEAAVRGAVQGAK